jgi:hypothetical protein
MPHSSLVKISLFLNLTAERIAAAGGVAEYVDGGPKKAKLTFDNAETQCMEIGTGLWIANNSTDASAIQCAYLTRMGINSLAALMEHVRHHLPRVLPVHTVKAGRRYVESRSEKEIMLRAIYELGSETAAPEEKAFPPNKKAQGPGTYSLTAENPPSTGGIVFVTGEYDGLPSSATCHAEQTLLAAALRLGTGRLRVEDQAGQIVVGGCKLPCGDCGAVLAAVKERRGYWFEYSDQKAADARTVAGQTAYGADRARVLALPALV